MSGVFGVRRLDGALTFGGTKRDPMSRRARVKAMSSHRTPKVAQAAVTIRNEPRFQALLKKVGLDK